MRRQTASRVTDDVKAQQLNVAAAGG